MRRYIYKCSSKRFPTARACVLIVFPIKYTIKTEYMTASCLLSFLRRIQAYTASLIFWKRSNHIANRREVIISETRFIVYMTNVLILNSSAAWIEPTAVSLSDIFTSKRSRMSSREVKHYIAVNNIIESAYVISLLTVI